MRTIKINGNTFKGILLPGWGIDEKVNAPASFKCTLLNINLNGQIIAVDIQNGYSIEIWQDDLKLFGGIIKKPTVSLYAARILQYEISANDYTELAYRRLIAASIINKTSGQIVRENILPRLAEDGVTEGVISDGSFITKANFNYIYDGDALAYLQEITGFNWWIDYDKRLYFVPNSEILASWVLDDSVPHSGFSHTLDHEQYRNTQYLRCGQGRSSVQTNEILIPSPDGKNREFFTRFPVSNFLKIEIKTGGTWKAVPDTDIGINGLNEKGTRKWYYSYGSKEISQNDDEPPLGAAQSIRITYVGLVNIFVRSSNIAEIQRRQEIEGGSGRYEQFGTKNSIDETKVAAEYAASLIAKYSEIADKISFSTEAPGLKAGQLLSVTKPDFEINQTFLIESVNIAPVGVDGVSYEVSALDGISLGSWETYFSGLLGSQEDSIQSDDIITIIEEYTDEPQTKSNVTITVFECIFPNEDLYPGDNLYPNSVTKSEVQVYD